MKQKYDIKFLTEHKFLLEIEECLPQLASKFLPYWWSKMPLKSKEKNLLSFQRKKTAKSCPSFADLYSSGYIIPMWTDTVLSRGASGEFHWETSNGNFKWDFHTDEQFVEYLDNKTDNAYKIFKAVSPWTVITSPNISIWQKPLFFNFNSEYEVLEGIINSDYHHEINQQVLYKSEKNEVFIPRGTPFAWYVPFERNQYNYSVGVPNNKELDRIKNANQRIFTKFSGDYKTQFKKLHSN